VYSLQTTSTSVGAWAAGILLVCLPVRGYVLHSETLLGTDVIGPVYGTAYVGAVLTLVAGALLVRGERSVTEIVTDSVLARPARSFGVGTATLAVLAILVFGFFAAIEGLSWLAADVGFLPVYFVLFLGALVLLAVGVSVAVYVIITVLFGAVFGYLAVGRAIVGPYGWPPVIIAGAVLANAIAFVPVASLVVELGLAATAIGGLLLEVRASRPHQMARTDPTT